MMRDRLTGIPVKRVKMWVYMFAGLMGGGDEATKVR